MRYKKSKQLSKNIINKNKLKWFKMQTCDLHNYDKLIYIVNYNNCTPLCCFRGYKYCTNLKNKVRIIRFMKYPI